MSSRRAFLGFPWEIRWNLIFFKETRRLGLLGNARRDDLMIFH